MSMVLPPGCRFCCLAQGTAAGVTCPQELKAPEEKFPEAAISEAGYVAIWRGRNAWNGVAILVRGQMPVEIQHGLPGDPDDIHSHYIEASLHDLIIGCLYLPNGNGGLGPTALVRAPHCAGSRITKSNNPVVLGRLQCDPERSRCVGTRALDR